MNKLKSSARKAFPKLYGRLAYYSMLYQMRKFKKQYPHCRLYYNAFNHKAKKYYSQMDQDFIVRQNFFKESNSGVYCDVGANHPLKINNTRFFEEAGWSGYAFEPLPHMQACWQKHRKASFFPYAASDIEGTIEFSMVEDVSGWEDMLSYVKETSSVNYNYKTVDISVKARPLKNVFKEKNITKIDYMSIDVEGHELRVLNGIDFSKVLINVLTIENNFGGASTNSNIGDDRIRQLMQENNFTLWGRIVGLDDIFVRNGFLPNSSP